MSIKTPEYKSQFLFTKDELRKRNAELKARLAAAEADNAHLREGLERIVDVYTGCMDTRLVGKDMRTIARQYLERGGKNEESKD